MDESIRDVLLGIHDTLGQLTPPDVIAEAQKKKSPLHVYFEWNDTKAGHLYRLTQARYMIRQVFVTVLKEGVETKQHVFYHTTDSENNPVYHSKNVLVKNITLLVEAERQAIVKLNIAKNTLDELYGLTEEKGKHKRYGKAKRHVDSAIKSMG